MAFDSRSVFQSLFDGTCRVLSSSELDRLEQFARGRYTGSALKAFEAAVARRRRTLNAGIPSPADDVPGLRSLRPLSPFERMMDDIIGATSVEELDRIYGEMAGAFRTSPERELLGFALEERRSALRSGA